MRKRMKRILTGTLTAALAASMIPAGAMAQGSGADRSGQTGGFVTDAPLQLEKTGGVTIGTADKDGGVAEIAAYNKDKRISVRRYDQRRCGYGQQAYRDRAAGCGLCKSRQDRGAGL